MAIYHSSSTPSTSPTSKTLIQTLVIRHFYNFIKAISKAKSILIEALKTQNPKKYKSHYYYPKKATKKQKKIFFGSFRLHYNWCSSHVVPVPKAEFYATGSHLYIDSTWNSVYVNDPPPQEQELSGYLQWLEDKVDDGGDSTFNDEVEKKNEIDRLADLFIQTSHEKFRLEKVESYRRFQEMLARSV